MSHAVDALRESDSEQLGSESSAPSDATALLQLAEPAVPSHWKRDALLGHPNSTESAGPAKSVGLQTTDSSSAEGETNPITQVSPAAGSIDVFGAFQLLRISPDPRDRLVCLNDEESPASESFRLLGVRLRHLRQERPLKKVLITSTIPEEGKSIITANLARTLALESQQKVLLIEGDLRRPSLSQRFKLGNAPGLCECLQSNRDVMESIYNLEGFGLLLLPAGRTRGNPLELLQSARLTTLMDQLTTWFDWIIIDTPPILPLADASVWTRSADGILLVTRQGTTRKRHLQRGIEAIDSKKLIGAILNGSMNSDHGYYYHHPNTALQENDKLPKRV